MLTHWGRVTLYASINIPSLVQIMTCRLARAKSLSELMLEYCRLGPWEQTSVKFYSKFMHFLSRKCISTVVWEVAFILSGPQCVKGQVCDYWLELYVSLACIAPMFKLCFPADCLSRKLLPVNKCYIIGTIFCLCYIENILINMASGQTYN